ncbi:MAG: isopentenyl-diphosphate delta-isomerase, partial [Bacteriovorax sp.]
LFSPHPAHDLDLSVFFLGKKLRSPLWISSMTGGVGEARHINQNLARVCAEFGLGMGLGSCRVLLEDNKYFNDFNLRPILGAELPLYANLGIAQVEKLLEQKAHKKIEDMLCSLDADGLIVHINPLQEWFQAEGDRYLKSPLETLTKLCELIKTKFIVKEVGQGMGPKSLKALLDLPIHAIELAAFGGTNFSKLEQMRGRAMDSEWMIGLSKVGHTAPEMVDFLNELAKENPSYREKQIIISGGIIDVLDGHYLRKKLDYTSVIGQAKNFLAHADNYDDLKKFTENEIAGLKMARAYLELKGSKETN